MGIIRTLGTYPKTHHTSLRSVQAPSPRHDPYAGSFGGWSAAIGFSEKARHLSSEEIKRSGLWRQVVLIYILIMYSYLNG